MTIYPNHIFASVLQADINQSHILSIKDKKAFDRGTSEAYYYMGCFNYDDNYMPKAFKLFKQSCTLGNMQSCLQVANMYELGYGVKTNYNKANIIYTKYCNDKHLEGCCYLGFAYEYGRAVPKDYKKALSLYIKSCNGGIQMGCYHIGEIYYYEHGVKKDIKKAKEIYKDTCENGYKLGCKKYKILNAE